MPYRRRMEPEKTPWTAIVLIRGREGFGNLHHDESMALAEIVDLGGRIRRVGTGFVASLYIDAATRDDAQAQIEEDLFDALILYKTVRAMVVNIIPTVGPLQAGFL